MSEKMDGSTEKIWQLKKGKEPQDEQATALLNGRTSPDSEVTDSIENETPASEETATDTTTQNTDPQPNKTKATNGSVSHLDKDSDTTKTDNNVSKSAPDLTEDADDAKLDANIKENGSKSHPLLNGLPVNGASTVLDIGNNVSRTSLWSQNAKKEGSVLSFHNVNYKVKVPGPKTRCGCGKKDDKFILKNLSGVCGPGMNAILGPTGSGKTSLLDILAGRKDPSGLSGQVLVDGKPQPDNFKCMAGYVIQDDIVVGMLSVKENIEFSAALRLPASVSGDQRKQRVDDVISELGLSDCADTKVGTALRRGVSGGERKRTNIAMEFITAPSVLFLDEPTTGLDATTAYSVMYQLKRLSRRGTTIIFSIHQPRYSIFKLFDNMMLMDRGEIVYQGPPTQALDYFSSIGYNCEEHDNPSDFILDVLGNTVAPSTEIVPAEEIEKEEKDDASRKLVIDIDTECSSEENINKHKQLVELFQASSWHTSVQSELEPIEKSLETSTKTRVPSVSYPTSFCRQLGIVGGRTFRNMIRNPHTLATQVMSAIILSLLVGSIFYQVDMTYTSGLQNRTGAFFFIVMNFVFSNMTAMDIFLKDRAVFIHENISGYYRVSVYFLSKMLCDVIPQKVLPSIVFAAISYWMIGLTPSVQQFLFFTLNIVLTSMAGTSVALIFSATVNNGSIGSLFTALVWVTMMIFSGLLVNIKSVPVWLRWIKDLSIFRYSMNAFSVNELKDLEFCDITANSTICDTGAEYMQRQGIRYARTWDLWLNEVMLAGLGFVFLTITYVQLRRLKKLR